jgi:hypothetical protein
MADTLLIRDKLQEAAFNLESYAFHEETRIRPAPHASIGAYVRMQTNNYRKGTRLLEGVIQEAAAVTFTLGDNPLTVHDPLLWPFWGEDIYADEGYYTDDCEAAADFYKPVVSLLPHSELVLNESTSFMGPGDSAPFPYFGNIALQRYVGVDEIAVSLLEGGHLSI